PSLADFFYFQLDGQPERRHGPADGLAVHPDVQEGGQRHVAARAAETVEMGHPHGLPLPYDNDPILAILQKATDKSVIAKTRNRQAEKSGSDRAGRRKNSQGELPDARVEPPSR